MRVRNWARTVISIGAAFSLAAALWGCGSSGGGGDTASTTVSLDPPAARTVVGQVDEVAEAAPRAAKAPAAGATVTLDDGTDAWPLDQHGRFALTEILDGDHSLFITSASGVTVEVPFRMLDGKGLSLGTVTIRNGQLGEVTGFDGYAFGFVDADGDGVNDLCCDGDGDGVCDADCLYARYTYRMNWGYQDADGDGRNERYRDANGDGINDLDGTPNGLAFGFVDADDDGINDNFQDANGDGICDQTGMPYRVDASWVDADGDGVNNTFRDADGDGLNDVTGRPYAALPGWVDLDGDGINDTFQDADGDGICDHTGLSYGHGYGFVDADGDGVNDNFTDADGDGVCDCKDEDGDSVCDARYARHHYRHGFLGPHVDKDDDGEPEGKGNSLREGFGWVDEDGDGVGDDTGHRYNNGYGKDPNGAPLTQHQGSPGAQGS